MTQHHPEFEDIRVVRLTRPTDPLRVQAAAVLLVAVLAILIVKPWGETPRPPSAAPLPSPAASTPAHWTRPAEAVRADGARVYDPGLFGRYTVSPRWELWPTAYVYQFGLSGPLAIEPARATPDGSRPPQPPPASPPPDASQLVDVGAADLLMVLGLNTPTGTRVLDARLWWFPKGGPAVRMALRELPPPWPVDTFHVYGLRVADDGDPDLVASWAPGVYRLDLLVDPGAEIRRIGLLVRPAADPMAPDRPSPSPTVALPTEPPHGVDLGLSVESQIVIGRLGGPWVVRDPPPQQDCGLMELWLAERERPGGPCWSIATSDVSVAAVDLGAGRAIERLSIEEIDPVAKAIDVVDRTEGASGGRIIVTADGRSLDEGTYRLVATMDDGSELGWYFRVLPADAGG